MTRTISLAGTTLELVERGEGRPLLFLHAGEGLAPQRSNLRSPVAGTGQASRSQILRSRLGATGKSGGIRLPIVW